MELSQLAKILLERGVVIKIVYSEENLQKFVTVINTKYYNIFGMNETSHKIANIITDEEIDIDKLKIDLLEYKLLPPGIFLKDLTEETALTSSFGLDFLLKDLNYVDRIKNFILQERANYINFLVEQLEIYDSNKTDLIKASYYLRLKKNLSESIEGAKKEAKQDIISKFYILKYNAEYILPGLRQIGCTNAIIPTKDQNIIEAVKTLWFNEIEKQKQIALIYIENTINSLIQNLDLSDDEKNEYLNQSKEYMKMVLNISRDIFDDTTTVREIINIWPEILHPLPYFAYGN